MKFVSLEILRPRSLSGRHRSAIGIGVGLGVFPLAAAAAYFYASRIESKAYRLERLNLTVGSTADGGYINENCNGTNSTTASASTSSTASTTSTGGRCLKILHISDLHLIEPEREKIDFLRSITGNEDIDLIFLTGDIFQNETGFQYASQILTKMPRLGAYAVLGNHDYYAYNMINKTIGRVYKPWRTPNTRRDVSGHIEALEFAGFQVLNNDIVRFDQEGFSIIGVDYFGIKPELLKSLADSVAEQQLLFGLFHVPKKLGMLSDAGIDIAFGGHTHGGQIRVPGIGAIITDSELKRHEASGIVRRGRTVFHISRGLGADPRSNVRLFCPPAATMIEVAYNAT